MCETFYIARISTKRRYKMQEADKGYSVGTLKYTFRQLVLISAIMMLSRHALSVVAYVLIPTIKPLILDKIGANATQIALVTGTIPSILNFILCPIISTMSDKTRTKYGRRIPYLIWSAPILAVIVGIMGFTPHIAKFLSGMFPSVDCNWGLWVLSILIVAFECAFMFPGSIFYYLEPDVIPKKCFGQYMAIANMTSSIIGATISFFLIKPTVDHMEISLPIFGLIYLAIYLAQFFGVKEGEYPPVEKSTEPEQAWYKKCVNNCTMYFRQCFSMKIYVFLALCTGLNAASTICRSLFGLLFATKEIGIDIDTIGKVTGICKIVIAASIYFFGRLMDKTHPMLVYFLGGIMIMGVSIFGYFFIIDVQTYIVFAITTELMYKFQGLASLPLMVQMLPEAKFGQYASGNAMVNSITLMIASALGGVVTTYFGYRVMFIWDFIVTGMAMAALGIVYLEWKRFGGKNYVAPIVN